jgi:hypothetical protein
MSWGMKLGKAVGPISHGLKGVNPHIAVRETLANLPVLGGLYQCPKSRIFPAIHYTQHLLAVG